MEPDPAWRTLSAVKAVPDLCIAEGLVPEVVTRVCL